MPCQFHLFLLVILRRIDPKYQRAPFHFTVQYVVALGALRAVYRRCIIAAQIMQLGVRSSAIRPTTAHSHLNTPELRLSEFHRDPRQLTPGRNPYAVEGQMLANRQSHLNTAAHKVGDDKPDPLVTLILSVMPHSSTAWFV